MKTILRIYTMAIIILIASGLFAQYSFNSDQRFREKKLGTPGIFKFVPVPPSNERNSSNGRDLAAVYDTLFYESFDGGAPGWAFKDLWSDSYWHISTTGAYSGQSYWCGIEGLGGYDDSWQQTLTSPSISLTGAISPVLTFKHHFRIETCTGTFNGFDAFDAVTVRISTDGEHFNIINPTVGEEYNAQNAYGFFLRFGAGLAGWSGDSQGWITSGFNLQAYAGQTIWIQFLFGSDEGYSSNEDPTLFGWRIDDIRIADGMATIFEDNAGDTGEAQFMPGSPGGPNLWHLTENESVSPPSSAGCFDTGSGNYMDCMNAALVSPAIPIGALPAHTRELSFDFQVKGSIDHYYYLDVFTDIIQIEVRPYQNGAWDYWSNEIYNYVIPETFHGYNDYNFYGIDVSNFMEADSLQIRIKVVSLADGQVMTPAKVFIDDFTLVAKAGYLGAQFGAFYDRVSVAPLMQRPAIADSFMATLPSCPIIEEKSIVTFLYRGDVSKITIPGIETWDTTICPMARIAGTDLWFYQTLLESDARLEYKFLLNGVTWINDPLNPDHTNYEYDNSQIRMPDYMPPLEIEYNPDIPHGTHFDTLITSSILGNTRLVRIYLPPTYETEGDKSFPIVLFHDGISYYNDGRANNIIDYLISENRIRPVIAVFVPPVQREMEYAYGLTAQFESFIIEELMPVIDNKYRTLSDPAYRAMAGSSYGGLISTQICYNRPESFGLCAAYSPAYGPNDDWEVYYNLIYGPKKNIRFYIEWGTHDYWILCAAIILKDNLLYSGYDVIWNEWHDGHNLGNWRAHLDNMLEYFFPASSGGLTDTKAAPYLITCYPNPFKSITSFEYRLDNPGLVTLKIFSHLGQEVVMPVNENQSKGKHKVTWNADGLPSGIYYFHLTAGSQSSTGKMVVVK